jgi:hypothetical protein
MFDDCGLLERAKPMCLQSLVAGKETVAAQWQLTGSRAPGHKDVVDEEVPEGSLQS